MSFGAVAPPISEIRAYMVGLIKLSEFVKHVVIKDGEVANANITLCWGCFGTRRWNFPSFRAEVSHLV